MIKGIGVDVVDLNRFLEKDEDRLDKIAFRILTPLELESYQQQTRWGKPDSLAKHWAVKEAVAKAFGTGFRDDVTYKNIELSHNELGAPQIKLYRTLANHYCLVSISHDGGIVIAYALLQ